MRAAWACFDCRKAVRHALRTPDDVVCPQCGDAAPYLGYKIPVPRRRDIKAWRALKADLQRAAQRTAEAAYQDRVRCIHDLEARLVDLETRPANEGRRRLIAQLRAHLERARSMGPTRCWSRW
ncbi:MAG: hypothetical protein QNJ98_20050 [Planctomycetota bacterium]|nr:hypothetical protein [Planctomycetota bacterium]